MAASAFEEEHILYRLKHYLPSQLPVKDFVLHKPMHAFHYPGCYETILRTSAIFDYQTNLHLLDFRKLYEAGQIREDIPDRIIKNRMGTKNLLLWKENLLHKAYNTSTKPKTVQLRHDWKIRYRIDLGNLVQPLLFRVLCGYLDQGISIWSFPVDAPGFLSAVKELEKGSRSLFKTSRAKELLLYGNCTIHSLLKIIVGREAFFEQYLFDQQFSHRGWSGIVVTIESIPHNLQGCKPISLHDLIIFELLLEIDTLDYHLGKNWTPLCMNSKQQPGGLFSDTPLTELREVLCIWQDAFEWSYYNSILTSIALGKKDSVSPGPGTKNNTNRYRFCSDKRDCYKKSCINRAGLKYNISRSTPGCFSMKHYFRPCSRTPCERTGLSCLY